jgi:hypothetical protein
MTSEKVIERLKAKNWYVKCENEHEQALLLNACLDAEIRWTCGMPAPCIQTTPATIIFIGREEKYDEYGLCWSYRDVYFKVQNCEDITHWFFNEINK